MPTMEDSSSPPLQDHTSLSPRLRHLLILEDRNTGKLFLPDGRKPPGDHDGPLGTSVQSSVSHGSSTLLSPPISPTTFAFAPSPIEKPTALPFASNAPRLLPPPTARPTSSIFSLLNEAPAAHSPPSSASSTRSRRPVSEDQRESPPYLAVAPPHTAPLPSHPYGRGEYFDRQIRDRYPASLAVAGHADRPSFYRRHSSHPYDYNTVSRPTTAYARTSQEQDFIAGAGLAGMGARAPISRTTKACNACRSRKVRCDAGGSGSGEPSMCSRCRESGVQCVYTGVQKKRGPCPGTARPSTTSKTRRPTSSQQGAPTSSHRSSIASVQSFVITPTEDQSWSHPGAYDFPLPTPTTAMGAAPTEWSSVAPGKASRPVTATFPGGMGRPPAVLSWPQMEPAHDIGSPPASSDQRKSSFDHHEYVGRPRGGMDHRRSLIEDQSRTLPPLRVAIDRRASSYYEK